MEEIKLNMENLSPEEREQLMKLIEKANKKESKIWKPELNKAYYYIHDSGTLSDTVAAAGDWTSSRYAIGNCFRTREEAEFALERQKVIVELERFAKEHNNTAEAPNYFIIYNTMRKEFKITWQVYNFCKLVQSFTSVEIAQKAIEAIGEERLKKYYFEVKE